MHAPGLKVPEVLMTKMGSVTGKITLKRIIKSKAATHNNANKSCSSTSVGSTAKAWRANKWIVQILGTCFEASSNPRNHGFSPVA